MSTDSIVLAFNAIFICISIIILNLCTCLIISNIIEESYAEKMVFDNPNSWDYTAKRIGWISALKSEGIGLLLHVPTCILAILFGGAMLHFYIGASVGGITAGIVIGIRNVIKEKT